MCRSIHSSLGWMERTIKSPLFSVGKLKVAQEPNCVKIFSFVHRHDKGVPYPCHLSSAQVSVRFIVPLWEATPRANKNHIQFGVIT